MSDDRAAFPPVGSESGAATPISASGGKRFSMPGGAEMLCQPVSHLSALAQQFWPGTPGLALSALFAKAVLGGGETWSLSVSRGGELLGGAFAVIERGRVNAKLTITAVDELPHGEAFIAAIERFADKIGCTVLVVEFVSRAELPTPVPVLKGEGVRYSNERLYMLDLAEPDLEKQFARRTKASINKAKKMGLTAACGSDEATLQAHFACTQASLNRREQRGESTALRSSQDRVRGLIEQRSARLFQARNGEQAMSSTVVLSLEGQCYYYDSGTTPEGMALGASQFLMASIITTLRDEGVRFFNLEIASAGNTGLMQYKEGFAPQLWFVERVTADRRSAWRSFRNLLRSL